MNPVSKHLLAIGLPVVTVAVTGVALAYWSISGSGSGSAGTATPAPLEITADTTPSGMGPGVAAAGITVTVRNPGPGSVQVSQLVVSISSVVKATGAPAGTCDSSDYTLAGEVMTVPTTALAAGTEVTFSGATLGFNDKATVQDGCKGATVNLAYAAS